jgi:broad specificity phosphatase PhoE
MGLILLVRHGQASWGAADYDQLSDLGVAQGEALGRHWAEIGVKPARVVGGALRRHRQTAEALGAGAGWDVPLEVDDGWDEFDHVQLLTAYGEARGVTEAPSGRSELDRWFDAAVARWTSGEHDADYPLAFGDFAARVDEALRRATENVGPGETIVVVTSGGPISWVLASLLGGDVGVWGRLNPVMTNASVSRVTVGSRGTTAVSFNEHGHLPAGLLTYR